MKISRKDIATLRKRLAWLESRISAARPGSLSYDEQEAGALRRTIENIESRMGKGET